MVIQRTRMKMSNNRPHLKLNKHEKKLWVELAGDFPDIDLDTLSSIILRCRLDKRQEDDE